MNIADSYRQQYEEFENYFSNTIIPQLFVDASLNLRKFTPPAMKQFSLSPDDLGRPISEIKDNTRFPSITENIKHVIATNEILEKEIQTTDMRWYQMNILPYVRRVDKVTDGVIITFVEITNRISDLRDLEKLIAEYELQLDELSHDIRNPLANMRLIVEQFKILSPKDENEYELMVSMMEDALKKMTGLVDDLTETRRLKHHEDAPVELLNLENIIEDVRLSLHENIIASGAVFESEIGISEVKFSRRKIRSVLYNLIGNSIKHRSPHRIPEILVRSERLNGHVVITVKDNGRGIEKSYHNRIFSKYLRLDKSVEGSGIGLHLVKGIVEGSGGKIEVKSEVDKGTEMKVYIPS